jgi:hypothetical protein
MLLLITHKPLLFCTVELLSMTSWPIRTLYRDTYDKSTAFRMVSNPEVGNEVVKNACSHNISIDELLHDVLSSKLQQIPMVNNEVATVIMT